MLSLGALNAYTDNPDELFNKGKNYFWVDFSTSAADFRRHYFPWDLDASIRNAGARIYGTLSQTVNKRRQTVTSVTQHPYQSLVLNHPEFRVRFNALFLDLLDNQLKVSELQADITDFEALLKDALLQDSQNQIGNDHETVALYFDYLRDWVAARDAAIRKQIRENGPPAPRP
jgi:hypothetical protein